ncbi:MAG TPA: rhomboid family intramembrane serine protease [Chitinophagaceae bacterium]|nr:rhomboid family intramembrane serine protease [Chitinophagaceae bacterium]
MATYRSGGMGDLPTVVKILLIINVAVFLAQQVMPGITEWGSLHYWSSAAFRPHQIVTMMFMHGGFTHLLFNMLVLWMFGSQLEHFWGSKRFFNFYMICGIGASIITLLSVPYTGMQYAKAAAAVSPEYTIAQIFEIYKQNYQALGASGALMGVMAAFAYLFPNTELFIMFIPVPVKAKYVIPAYVLIDLFGGLGYSTDNVAHFAHLGGFLVGFIIVLFWNRTNRKNFY